MRFSRMKGRSLFAAQQSRFGSWIGTYSRKIDIRLVPLMPLAREVGRVAVFLEEFGDPVQAMSHYLNEYGASPIRAEITQKRSMDNQTLYEVKLVFPRGDATSLLFGFDAEGKITGIVIMSMAGD